MIVVPWFHHRIVIKQHVDEALELLELSCYPHAYPASRACNTFGNVVHLFANIFNLDAHFLEISLDTLEVLHLEQLLHPPDDSITLWCRFDPSTQTWAAQPSLARQIGPRVLWTAPRL